MLRRLRAPVPPEPPPAHATAFPASPLARAPSLRHPRIPTPRHLRPSLRKAIDRRVLHPAPPGPGLHGSAAGPSSPSAALGASFLAGFDGKLPFTLRGSASFALPAPPIRSIPWSTHSPFAGFPSWAPSEGGFPSKPATKRPFAGWAGLVGLIGRLGWPGRGAEAGGRGRGLVSQRLRERDRRAESRRAKDRGRGRGFAPLSQSKPPPHARKKPCGRNDSRERTKGVPDASATRHAEVFPQSHSKHQERMRPRTPYAERAEGTGR